MKKKLTPEIIIRRMIRLKAAGHSDFFKLWNKLRLYLYKTPEYQAWMAEVKRKSSFRCARTSCRKKPRECHHKIRVYEDPARSLDVENGEYLCMYHHRKAHAGSIAKTYEKNAAAL